MTHLYIEQNTGLTEEVSTSIISKLYELASSGDLDNTSDLKGRLHSSVARDTHVAYLNEAFDDLYINADILYMTFLDPLVEQICIENYGDSGAGVTRQQLSQVHDIATGNTTGIFCNTDIEYFNEYKYFTGITTNSVGYGLYGLSKLKEITFPTVNLFLNPNNTTDASKSIPSYCLSGATSLREVDMSGITCLTWGGTIGNCPNLTWSGVKMPNAKYYADRIFRNCTSLEKVIFPEGTLECAGVNGCTSIQYVEYPTTLTAFYAHMSYHGTSNVSIVFKSVVPPTYTPYNSAESNLKNMFGNGNNALNSNGSYIYVPDNSVTAYKTADKWSYYESIIKPLSQLPAERLSMGTVTQEDIDRV